MHHTMIFVAMADIMVLKPYIFRVIVLFNRRSTVFMEKQRIVEVLSRLGVS